MLTQPPQISPEADFGCFSKSLQKERTANPREILSRIHPSKLQTEPRSEKHMFVRFFHAKIQSVVLKPNIYAFGILDPLGDLGSPLMVSGRAVGSSCGG